MLVPHLIAEVFPSLGAGETKQASRRIATYKVEKKKKTSEEKRIKQKGEETRRVKKKGKRREEKRGGKIWYMYQNTKPSCINLSTSPPAAATAFIAASLSLRLFS